VPEPIEDGQGLTPGHPSGLRVAFS
jgi:hypothetical protein